MPRGPTRLHRCKTSREQALRIRNVGRPPQQSPIQKSGGTRLLCSRAQLLTDGPPKDAYGNPMYERTVLSTFTSGGPHLLQARFLQLTSMLEGLGVWDKAVLGVEERGIV